MADAKQLLDGKRIKWTIIKTDSPGDKALMCCMSCGIANCDPACNFSFLNSFSDDGKKWTMKSAQMRCCGVPVCFPSSVPCPIIGCCAPAGTPCALVFHWVRDPSDPAKWIATGSVCEQECCLGLTNHDGDYVKVDADHDGSPEKPMVMWGGKNPQTPPCFQNRIIPGGMTVMGGAGGAPTLTTMER
jgi:hypothetical protein